MGIGAIIGAGVFVLTGVAAATSAGPAIIFSYLIAGFASLFAALAYAELATSIGGAGSAYSYAYASFGELVAWIIGWDLLLEYAMSVATVAIGWSGYVDNFFAAIHLPLPFALTHNPFEGGLLNLPALLIIFTLAILLCIGVKQSARFNAAIVFIKLLTIAVFITVAVQQVDLANWTVFLPFGWSGVIHGAALVFFAYIGFDALSTAVEETIDPQRNAPIGILASLVICTLIYIVVAGLLTSIVPYTTLNVPSPVADALLHLGHHTAAAIVAAGAVAGLTTVMLVMYYGLTRIILAMSRDGLLPGYIACIHPNTCTPIRIIIITAVITGTIAALTPIGHAAELVNIGTLAAFTLVCGGVIILRVINPDLPRPFKVPFMPWFPLLGVFSCFYLMLNLATITWWRFWLWMAIGLIVYFCYSRKRSHAASL
jgi:APA family basic amino acid/polyamine antiporter